MNVSDAGHVSVNDVCALFSTVFFFIFLTCVDEKPRLSGFSVNRGTKTHILSLISFAHELFVSVRLLGKNKQTTDPAVQPFP